MVKNVLPGELSQSFQKPNGVSVKRHRRFLNSLDRYCALSSGFNVDQTHVCEFTLGDTLGHPAVSQRPTIVGQSSSVSIGVSPTLSRMPPTLSTREIDK